MKLIDADVVPESEPGGGCVLRIKPKDNFHYGISLSHDAAILLRIRLEVVTKSWSGAIGPEAPRERVRSRAD